MINSVKNVSKTIKSGKVNFFIQVNLNINIKEINRFLATLLKHFEQKHVTKKDSFSSHETLVK